MKRLCLTVFLLLAPLCARCGAIADYGLSRCASYVQRGILSVYGREIPITVCAAKLSRGGYAMSLDAGAGALVKGRFSADGKIAEMSVSDALAGRRRGAEKLAAEIFRLSLGLLDSVGAKTLSAHSENGLPQFAETENVRVDFLEYGENSLPKLLEVGAGAVSLRLRLVKYNLKSH